MTAPQVRHASFARESEPPMARPEPIAFDARVRLNLLTSESRIERYAAIGELVVDDLGLVDRARIRVTVKQDADGWQRRPWARKVYPRHPLDALGRVR